MVDDTLSMLLAVTLRMHQTRLTVLLIINVSIDYDWNEVPNLLWEKNILDCNFRQRDAWFVFCFKINCVQR